MSGTNGISRVTLTMRECAADYHEPYHRTATMCDPVGQFTCRCGAVMWKPEGER